MAETVEHSKDVTGMKILIHPNVYPPGTDTYLLANAVRVKPGDEALDLCTGTGAIACKMAMLGAKRVLAIDLNPRAVANAKANAKQLKLKNITVRQGNMFEGVSEKFDVITINPPYTDKTAGNDIDICFFDKDHKFVRSFFANLRAHLKKDGIAYIAWSNISDMKLLPRLAKKHDFNIQLLAEDIGRRGYTFYVYLLSDAADPKSFPEKEEPVDILDEQANRRARPC